MVTRCIRSSGRLIIAVGLVFAVVGPQSAAAQEAPVGLGTAETFAVLAGEAVTNTGTTTVTGDVGVSPGSEVGLPPTSVDGAIHAADGVALQAKVDLVTAYDDAAGRATTETVGVELGDQTFMAGVYTGGELGLTGTLTLDAEGDENAVFVFQAASALTTASASAVELINGANPCNVFWQVGSSAVLGTDSDFVGTILALTSITANSGATVEGRLLARTGAVTLANNVITAPLCESASTTTTTSPGDTTTTTADGAATTTTTVAGAATTSMPPITTLPDTGGVIGVTAVAALLAVGIGSALVLLVARRSPPTPHRG